MGNSTLQELTPVEKKLLLLLSEGLTEQQAAKVLHRSKYTIDKYLRSIFEKYKVHGTTAAVAKAIRRTDIE